MLVLACADSAKRGATDSAYARDLALAGQTQAVPELRDTALSAPARRAAPAPARREARTATSARAELPVPAPPASAPRDPVVEPLAAPSPPPFRGIPAGANFTLTTRSPICTTNRPGDKITATITATVSGANGAAIPAGTTVVLDVAEVIPGDTPESARIVLRIRSVFINDQPVALPSDVAVTSELERHQLPRDKGSDRRKVVGGAVAGAVIGQIMGKDTKSTITGAAVGTAAGAAAAAGSRQYDACLPGGGSLKVTTTQPLPITG